jgi:excisionase family DNA binding protein
LTRLVKIAKMSCMTQQGAHLTVSQAAAELAVHPATIRRWIADGRLHAIRLPGGTYRIRRTDVAQILGGAA